MPDHVALATFTSLVRIAGGGCISSSSSSSSHHTHNSHHCRHQRDGKNKRVDDGDSSSLGSSWISELKRIAYKSVSFPNGRIINNKQYNNNNYTAYTATTSNGDDDDDDDDLGGKPHDVEVRAALILFHSILRGGKGERGNGNNNKKKRTKRNHSLGTNECNCGEAGGAAEVVMDDVSREEFINDNEDEEPSSLGQSNDGLFEIVSDMGTRRVIDSIKSLATLLSMELEIELNNIVVQDDDHTTFTTTTTSTSSCKHNNFLDIRSNESGIIHLTSHQRYHQLRSCGRLPCPYCTNWFMGTKGLWWHSLRVHNIKYSDATENATTVNGNSSLAIVPYEVAASLNFMNCQQKQNPQQHQQQQHLQFDLTMMDKNNNDNIGDTAATTSRCTKKKVPTTTEIVFDMIKKSCTYNDFVHIISSSYNNFCPKTQVDGNGASAIHWAAGCGRLDIVIYLVEDCNCCPSQGQDGKRSFRGRTPLHWAARNGHLPIVTYLVCTCKVDINATTFDGTTAFCWSAWQGHLDIMKFLHEEHGCDLHRCNSFGCNAVLWCAQGGGDRTSEILSWLYESGANFHLTNSNKHSAFHKAAQRCSIDALSWLADKFLSDKEQCWLFIGPDTEGNCPSDLCHMEGDDVLAEWISCKEVDSVYRMIGSARSVDDLKLDKQHSNNIPAWLVEDLLKVKGASMMEDDNDASYGVRRLTLKLMKYFTKLQHVSKDEETERNAAATTILINDTD